MLAARAEAREKARGEFPAMLKGYWRTTGTGSPTGWGYYDQYDITISETAIEWDAGAGVLKAAGRSPITVRQDEDCLGGTLEMTVNGKTYRCRYGLRPGGAEGRQARPAPPPTPCC